MRNRLALLLLPVVALLPSSPAVAQQQRPFEPVDDLQWLAIENIVGPVLRPESVNLEQGKQLTERAREALLAGRLGEARRLYSRARAMIFGMEWDEQAEFVSSLALRPAHVAVDPDHPLILTVGQHFPAPAPGRIAQSGLEFRFFARRWEGGDAAEIIPLGQTSLITPDLAEQPQYVHLYIGALSNGSWEIGAEIMDDNALVGTTSTRIFTATGLQEDLRRLHEGLENSNLRPGLRASIAYPLNLVQTLDLRTRRIRAVDLRFELDSALSLLASAGRGEDPLWQSAGTANRHYHSETSGRIEPYRVFAPHGWDSAEALPLLVMLHGSMGDERSVFADGRLANMAQELGIVVLSPMGDDPNGVWGNRLPVVLADGSVPSPRPVVSAGRVQSVEHLPLEPAEADVAATIALVREEFPIDPDRIYLAGNSMGGEGTIHLATKWPDVWAAIAPGAGPIDPDLVDYQTLKRIPTLVIHGRDDPITSFAASQRIFERLEEAGGHADMLATEGGHDAFAQNLEQILDYLLTHSKQSQDRQGGRK